MFDPNIPLKFSSKKSVYLKYPSNPTLNSIPNIKIVLEDIFIFTNNFYTLFLSIKPKINSWCKDISCSC